MNVKEILNRGVQETKCADESYSHTGRPDFQEASPQIIKMEPKGPNTRPRTIASKLNSYT